MAELASRQRMLRALELQEADQLDIRDDLTFETIQGKHAHRYARRCVMRLPIVHYPSIVVDDLRYFTSVFRTEEQKKHICEYVTGLMAGDKKTVAVINTLFLNNNDQGALSKFLTQAEWDERELNRRRIQLELDRSATGNRALARHRAADAADSTWSTVLLPTCRAGQLQKGLTWLVCAK